MFQDGTRAYSYRYVKAILDERLVHVITPHPGATLSWFVDFMEDLADAERSSGTIVVDLREVRTVDAQFIAALHRADRRLRMRNRSFLLVCPHSDIRRVLELTGVRSGPPIYASVEEVIGALRAVAAT